MKTIGIVAEYNPFHRGHAYHIAKSREALGEESAVLVAMSGDFVQRGEAAIAAKHSRAADAVRGGADLVIELPLAVSLSSAEGFAREAVRLLAAFQPDVLSFGSETQDLDLLKRIAELVAEEDFIEAVKAELKNRPEQSFAAARQTLVEERIGHPVPELKMPNCILAIEYLKALRNLPGIAPLCIGRIGAGHDELGENTYPSASELRHRLREAGIGPDPEREELLMLDRLRRCSREDFPSDSLGDSIWREIRQAGSYEGLLQFVSTRRYPLSRVRRTCIRAVLRIQDAGIPYYRILAFNERGRALLHGTEGLPLLTKPADVRKLSTTAKTVFQLTSEAHDYYNLLLGRQKPGEDWRTGPVLC